MKHKINQIMYFKPNYSLAKKVCWVCQIIKYMNNNRYLLLIQDIFSPFHYYKAFANEDDLGDIKETFVLEFVSLEDLSLNLSIEKVMKLRFVDLYSKNILLNEEV